MCSTMLNIAQLRILLPPQHDSTPHIHPPNHSFTHSPSRSTHG